MFILAVGGHTTTVEKSKLGTHTTNEIISPDVYLYDTWSDAREVLDDLIDVRKLENSEITISENGLHVSVKMTTTGTNGAGDDILCKWAIELTEQSI